MYADREFTDAEATEFKLAMKDPAKWKQLYEKTAPKTSTYIHTPSRKRKVEGDAPLLDEEEMKIFKESKVYEDDETTPPMPLENKEEDMDMFKDANIDDDYYDFLKDYDSEGGKRRRKTRKGGRRHRKHNTKKHHRKSKTHKKRKMHKKHRTHRRR